MIRAIAIDDEPFALEVVEKLAEKVSFLQLNQTFTNAFDAMEYLQGHKVDVLFLDIKMPDISGIDLFNSLQIKPLVIFTTAYAEHALTGFELDAVDYLLKPFSFGRFLKACNKAREVMEIRASSIQEEASLFVKCGYDLIRIVLNELLYLEATGNYVNFVTKNRTINSRMTLAECLVALPDAQFIQIHRSFIINRNAVDKLERHQVTIQDYVLPLAASYKKRIPKKLLMYHGNYIIKKATNRVNSL